MIPFFFCVTLKLFPFFFPPLVSARSSPLSFPVAFMMAAAINVPLGRAFVKKTNKTKQNKQKNRQKKRLYCRLR